MQSKLTASIWLVMVCLLSHDACFADVKQEEGLAWPFAICKGIMYYTSTIISLTKSD